MSNIIVAAIQAEAEECYTEEHFQRKISRLAIKAAQAGAQLAVFPEDIGLWLIFCQESPIHALRHPVAPLSNTTPPHWRKWLESAGEWLLRRLPLQAMGQQLAAGKLDRIIRRVFARAAQEAGIVLIGGSTYGQDTSGNNVALCHVFDRDGSLAGTVYKSHLVAIEEAWGYLSGNQPRPIITQDFVIGACICYDLNYPEVAAILATHGAQLLCAGSAGWRLFPGYPFDETTDMPHIQRAKETGLAVVRPYQCGWMVPGIYFEGHTSIVGPDGSIIARSKYHTCEQIVLAEVPLKDK